MVHPSDPMPPNPIPMDGIPLGTPRVPNTQPSEQIQPGFFGRVYLQLLSLLCCSTSNRIEPASVDTPSARTLKPSSDGCSIWNLLPCTSDAHIVNDRYHNHPSRRIPKDDKKPEFGHEFDEWLLGEARAPELIIDDSNTLEYGQKLARILHSYHCIQKIKGNIEYMLTGDAEPVYDCTKRYCENVRSDLFNLVKCRGYCENAECSNLLTIIKHWRECTNETCPVCAPSRVEVPDGEESPRNDVPLTIPCPPLPLLSPSSVFVGFKGNAFSPYPKTQPPVDWRLHLPDGIREHLSEKIFYDYFVDQNLVVGGDYGTIVKGMEAEVFEKAQSREEYYARVVLLVHNLRNPDNFYEHFKNSWQRHISVGPRTEETIKLFITLKQDFLPPENHEKWLFDVLDYARCTEAKEFWTCKTFDKYLKHMTKNCRNWHVQNRVCGRI